MREVAASTAIAVVVATSIVTTVLLNSEDVLSAVVRFVWGN